MQESSSELLVQNCDEYYSYNSLSGLTAASEATTESFDPWVLAAKTIRRMVDRGDVMRSDRFKQVMLEFDPSFSEKSLGFSKFNRFLAEAASRGIVDLEKAANGQYDVSPGSHADEFSKGGHPVSSGSGSSGRSSSRSSSSSSRSRSRSDSSSGGRSGGGSRSRSSSRRDGGSRRSSGDRGRREAPPSDQPTPEVDVDRLRTAYKLLQDVVEDLARVGQPVRDSEIKRQMLKRDSQFDEGALGFRKFSRFLRQAHDEEVINLEQGPEGNYLVSPLNGAASGGRSGSDEEARRAEKAAVDEGSDSSSAPSREPSREEPAAPAASREPETKPEPRADTRSESKAESKAEPERRSRGRGLGRFRRGSKGRSSAPKAATSEDRTVPGPVDAAPAGDGAEDEKNAAVPEKPAAKEVHAARSVTGRGSSRESAGPRAGASAPGNGASSGSGSGGKSGADRGGAQVSEKYREEIDAMSRAYPGVGRRTAERLYEEFGDRLLDVIDNQPQRISDVLPEHRAKAVIEGREAQRDENA
jgi:hypothetical protein